MATRKPLVLVNGVVTELATGDTITGGGSGGGVTLITANVTIYVDSNTGNDTNDGLTFSTPLATIGAATKLALGMSGPYNITIEIAPSTAYGEDIIIYPLHNYINLNSTGSVYVTGAYYQYGGNATLTSIALSGGITTSNGYTYLNTSLASSIRAVQGATIEATDSVIYVNNSQDGFITAYVNSSIFLTNFSSAGTITSIANQFFLCQHNSIINIENYTNNVSDSTGAASYLITGNSSVSIFQGTGGSSWGPGNTNVPPSMCSQDSSINDEIGGPLNALGLVPYGGDTTEVLMKNSAVDHDYGFAPIHQVPAGGTTNQVLAKNSDTDYDYWWVTSDTPIGKIMLISNGRFLM